MNFELFFPYGNVNFAAVYHIRWRLCTRECMTSTKIYVASHKSSPEKEKLRSVLHRKKYNFLRERSSLSKESIAVRDDWYVLLYVFLIQLDCSRFFSAFYISLENYSRKFRFSLTILFEWIELPVSNFFQNVSTIELYKLWFKGRKWKLQVVNEKCNFKEYARIQRKQQRWWTLQVR